MDAFLTGGSGFVGSHVARLLVERGARVRCLVRPTSRTSTLRALAARIISTAVSKTPSRAHTRSCVSRMPSRCTLVVRRLCGAMWPKTFLSRSSAFVQR